MNTLCVASIIPAVTAVKASPGGLAPWVMPTQVDCLGDRDICCRTENCQGTQLDNDPEKCIEESPRHCYFYQSIDVPLNGSEQICFNEFRTAFKAKLPSNVFNSKIVWEHAEIEIGPFGHVSPPCLTTSFQVTYVVFQTNDPDCAGVTTTSAHAANAVTFHTTHNKKTFKSEFSGATETLDDTSTFLHVNLQSILSRREHGDVSGVVVQPFSPECKMVMKIESDPLPFDPNPAPLKARFKAYTTHAGEAS